MKLYVDTSAAAKLMIEEPESAALAEFCDRRDVELLSTDLLETELRRVAHRDRYPQQNATEVLDRIALHGLTRSAYRDAGLLAAPALRSLDALHITGASRLDAAAILTYDDRMTDAAVALGFIVVQPGRDAATLRPGASAELSA